MRVLVVEDQPDAAESLRLLLQLVGHELRVALNGPEGIEIASTWQPDVVLSDIGMPGMDGYEVARRLPGMENLHLVALTGYGRDEDRRRSREAGFDLHLVKPTEPDVLWRVVGMASCR